MKNKYTVKHYYSNPRNNRTVECTTKSAAWHEGKIMTADSHRDGCSEILRNGEIIAKRYWNRKNMKPIGGY